MPIAETTIELPVSVYYDLVSAEGDGWHEPHIPAHPEINDIELADVKFDMKIPRGSLSMEIFKRWIIDKNYRQLIEACMENENDR